MKNIVAELLIKLAEKDEEYKFQQERLAAMELIVSALLETLPSDARLSFQQKFESLTHSALSYRTETDLAPSYAGCLEKIAAMKQL